MDGRLPLLLDVVRRYPARAASVQAIFARRNVTSALDAEDIIKSFAPIIELSSNLLILTFEGLHPYPMANAVRREAENYLLQTLPSSLLYLYVHLETQTLSEILSAIGRIPDLRSMKFTSFNERYTFVGDDDESCAAVSHACLPSLVALSLYTPSPNMARAMIGWQMPNLSDFALDFDDDFDNDILVSLFAHIGPQLRSLDLLSGTCPDRPLSFIDILKSCTSLETFKFDVERLEDWIPVVPVGLFKSLKHLHLWADSFFFVRCPKIYHEKPSQNCERNLGHITRDNFPQLQSVRFRNGLWHFKTDGGLAAVVKESSEGFLALVNRCIRDGIHLEDDFGNPLLSPETIENWRGENPLEN